MRYQQKYEMNTAELQSELHQIIDQIKDHHILTAVHKILRTQVISAYSIDGKPLLKSEVDLMLQDSEVDIENGQLINQANLKEEIKTWRNK